MFGNFVYCLPISTLAFAEGLESKSNIYIPSSSSSPFSSYSFFYLSFFLSVILCRMFSRHSVCPKYIYFIIYHSLFQPVYIYQKIVLSQSFLPLKPQYFKSCANITRHCVIGFATCAVIPLPSSSYTSNAKELRVAAYL